MSKLAAPAESSTLKSSANGDPTDILLSDWLELVRNYTVPPSLILLSAAFFYDRTLLATPEQSQLMFWGLTWIAFLYTLLSAVKFSRRRFQNVARRGIRELLWAASFALLLIVGLSDFFIAARIADHQHRSLTTAVAAGHSEKSHEHQ